MSESKDSGEDYLILLEQVLTIVAFVAGSIWGMNGMVLGLTLLVKKFEIKDFRRYYYS